MAIVMNVQEAKTNLSRLLGAVANGDEVTIANRGVPVAKLVPFEKPKKRELGFVKAGGKMDMEAFFEPMSEEDLRLWGC